MERGNKGRTLANGVVVVKNNKEYVIKARKEVIVSAGSYGTPQLLMLSGIGPRDHLESLQVERFLNVCIKKFVPAFYGIVSSLILKRRCNADEILL